MSRDTIRLPHDAYWLLQTLRAAGHSAYVVGGCVRDSLLGRMPGDWDICTSARPDEMRALFHDQRMILTGEKHGTVAVILHGKPYEMTTYRLDGSYRDHRHPDSVQFVDDLAEDLARRDFTINAMAYAPGEGIIDLYGGRRDLAAGIVRCVGTPADPLCRGRAAHSAGAAVFRQAGLCAGCRHRRSCFHRPGDAAHRQRRAAVFRTGRPAAGPRRGADFGTIRRDFRRRCAGDLTLHRLHAARKMALLRRLAAFSRPAVAALDLRGQDTRGVRVLCWATFLHDIAKPLCRSVGPDGAAHFKGHNQRGAQLARGILRRLKAPAYLIDGAVGLIAVHDAPLPADDAGILKLLNRNGAIFLRRLCALKYADLDAHARTPEVAARRADVEAFEHRMDELAKTGCYTMRQLTVNGADLMDAGIPAGPDVGATLQMLLTAVMEGKLPNEREALLKAVIS